MATNAFSWDEWVNPKRERKPLNATSMAQPITSRNIVTDEDPGEKEAEHQAVEHLQSCRTTSQTTRLWQPVLPILYHGHPHLL